MSIYLASILYDEDYYDQYVPCPEYTLIEAESPEEALGILKQNFDDGRPCQYTLLVPLRLEPKN